MCFNVKANTTKGDGSEKRINHYLNITMKGRVLPNSGLSQQTCNRQLNNRSVYADDSLPYSA